MTRTLPQSIFWPLVLIALGLLWLLSNLGVIAGNNLWVLLRFWPVLLIVGGLDLLVRGRWPWASHLISLATVTLAVMAVIFAPQWGLTSPGWSQWGWLPFSSGSLNTVRGSGQTITETRPVSDFNAVSFGAFGEMTITQGDREALTLEGEDNVLPLIRTEVRNGTLYVEPQDDNFGINLTRPLRYTLVVKTLSALDLSGAGNIKVNALHAEQLQINLGGAGSLTLDELVADMVDCRLSGAGSVKASGKATRLVARLSGLGSYEGQALEAEAVEVTISGAGSATVWATQTLEAHISGLGSVRYYGDPRVTQAVSGLGSVQQMDDK